MRCAMHKPQGQPFKIFAARITELNNYLPIFPGPSAIKKMIPEELNEILLHVVPNVWAKQAYLQGWDLEGSSYKDTCDMFERMDISEQVYKVGTTFENANREESDHARHGSKRKGGESASSTNTEKCRTGKSKINHAVHPSNGPDGAKTTLLVHGPRHSTEECRVLNKYSEKYAAQRPHK